MSIPVCVSREELDVSEGEEKINYLEVEEASSYLVFNKEESGVYTLRGGPIDALIAYAASTTNAGTVRGHAQYMYSTQ